MLDVLVALLLLAVVLTGACATSIQAIRATSDALRAMQAADLAADFTEELRTANSAAQAEALVATWRSQVPAMLPVGSMAPEEFFALALLPPHPAQGATAPAVVPRTLRLRWLAAGNDVRELILPVAAQWEEAP